MSMCLFPGAMRALPLITVSLSSASFTEIAQTELSLFANDAVNFSGMCWTMTMPGESGGIDMRNSLMASVPPVDAPTTMTFSVVRGMAFVAFTFVSTASALSFCETGRGAWGFLSFAIAAALMASHMRMGGSPLNSFVPAFGLVIISTAP